MRITLGSNPSYSEYISSLYDVFAHGDAPALLSVREFPKLILAAEWLKKQGFQIDEEWVEEKTQPVLLPSSEVVVAPRQEELNLEETVDIVSQEFKSEYGSGEIQISNAKASPDRLSFDITQTFRDADSGKGTQEVKSSCKVSCSDYNWLLEGIPVKMPVSGNIVSGVVVPAENTWHDFRAATIAPYWSMQYDDNGGEVEVDHMSWGGCSMMSFNAEPVRTKRRASPPTLRAGSRHISYRNDMVGTVGMTAATEKSLDDEEIADLKKATAASRKQQKLPQWDARESGSSRGKRRLLGSMDTRTLTGDIHNEQGQRVVDSREVHVRMEVSVCKNGKEVEPPVTMISRLGLPKPAKQKVMLPPNLVVQLKETFKRNLCKKAPMSSPVLAASCCSSILGCEQCVNDHYAQQGIRKYCPSCRSSEGYRKTFRLHGIDEILQALNNGTTNVDSAVFAESLKCTVCHSTPLCSQPAVATCCGRIVGCSECIKLWHETKDQCPLCLKGSGRDNTVRVRGMEPILQQLDEFLHHSEEISP